MEPFVPDRRSCKRVRIGDDAFVCLTPVERKPWHILDVSRGGLSFRYVERLEAEEQTTEMEIVTRDTAFSMENIPFRTVSDMEILGSGTMRFRRRGVQFGNLTEHQTSQLDHLIRHYSVGSA